MVQSYFNKKENIKQNKEQIHDLSVPINDDAQHVGREEQLMDLISRADELNSGASELMRWSERLKERYQQKNKKRNRILIVVVLIAVSLIVLLFFGRLLAIIFGAIREANVSEPTIRNLSNFSI